MIWTRHLIDPDYNISYLYSLLLLQLYKSIDEYKYIPIGYTFWSCFGTINPYVESLIDLIIVNELILTEKQVLKKIIK